MAEKTVAIVTGAAVGIGREAAVALAGDGRSIVCVDVDASRVESVAQKIRERGAPVSVVAGDVSREAIWRAVVAAANKLGRLEVLVSNAAIFPRIAFENTHVEDFDRVMAVNLRSAFLGAWCCVPILRQAGGSLVFMTSGGGQMSAAANPMQRGFSLYGASKAALDRWVAGIAPELAPYGIAANLLCPGAPVPTEGFNRLKLGDEAPAETISAARVAEAIAWLAERRPPQTGGRFVASEFGTVWGPISAAR